MATGDPTHGPVSQEIIGEMENYPDCVEVRSRKPFMSVIFQRDYTPYEQANLHVIFHRMTQDGIPGGDRRFA